MAEQDQVTLPGTGEIVAVQTIDDKQYQLVKIVTGSTDSTTPVTPLTDTELRATAVPVSASTLPLPSGAATSENQVNLLALETSLNSLIETLQELVQRLAPLAGAMSSTAQIRAVVTGAVTATGGGYITNANMVAALLTQTDTLKAAMIAQTKSTVDHNVNNCIGV